MRVGNMAINNPQDVLNEGVALPLAIEAVLPAGAPKISTFLTQVAADAPVLPDFPAPLPDLPAFTSTPPPPEVQRTPITIIWD
jgi:hypothetical protein